MTHLSAIVIVNQNDFYVETHGCASLQLNKKPGDLKMSNLRFLSLCGLLLLTLVAFADVPGMINYQGKLTKADGTLLADGSYSMTFAIYAQPTGGLPIWSEPNPSVQVKKGLFSVLLGSLTNLPANIFSGAGRYFGVTVGTDPEMTPRQLIASVPFALKAGVADTVVDGSITKAKLASDVTTTTMDAITTGWVPVNETWNFATATTILVPDTTISKFSVGDKLRFTQDGVTKYFYITSIGNNFLAVTAGFDFTVTNTAISNNFYSKVISPIGFPQWFNYTPTVVGLTNPNYTQQTGRFKIVGNEVTVKFGVVIATWSDQTWEIIVKAPLTTNSNGGSNGAGTYYRAAGSSEDGSMTIYIDKNSNNIKFINSAASSPIHWEASSSVGLSGTISFEL